VTAKNSDQFENFDHTMRELMKVSHDEIKDETGSRKISQEAEKEDK
jgi:hypothetical protein